jgi:hypothetical protein
LAAPTRAGTQVGAWHPQVGNTPETIWMEEGDKADALWVSNELAELQARVAALELLVRDLAAHLIATSPKVRRTMEGRSRTAKMVADDRTAVQNIKFSTHYRYLEILQEYVRQAMEGAQLDEPG